MNHSLTKALLSLRAIVFFMGIGFFTFMIGIISIFTFPFPLPYRYSVITQWSHWVVWWGKWICGWKYQVIGAENIPDGAAILMSNHQSAWEGIYYQILFPPQTWVIKRELLRIPFLGWALASLQPIAIDRRKKISALDQLIRQGKKHLQNGRWVVIFPEGTRSEPGKIKRFSLGGAVLAAETGLPVLPVAHNAGEFWPPSQLMKLPGTIKVMIGPVIDSQGLSPQEINEKAKKWIKQTLQNISNQSQPHPLLQMSDG